MKRCEEVRVELPGLLRGELGTQTAISVNIHLRDCAACSIELEELRDTIKVLREIPLQYDPDPDLEQRVFMLTSFEEIGSLVSAAPLEKEPPIDLEARSLVRAGVLDSMVDSKRSRWSKVAMVLAPTLAATAIVFAFLATEWRSRFTELEDIFGGMGQPLASQQLTSFDTSNRAQADLFDSTQETYQLVLRTYDLPATPDGYRYELWLSGERGTVPAGSFSLNGPEDHVFVFTVSVSPWEYPDLEITLEPDDGNPEHTGTTVMEASFNLP
jgi:Anti-sigma-K factor rskA, C-terminal/Putative zinc-finger